MLATCCTVGIERNLKLNYQIFLLLKSICKHGESSLESSSRKFCCDLLFRFLCTCVRAVCEAFLLAMLHLPLCPFIHGPGLNYGLIWGCCFAYIYLTAGAFQWCGEGRMTAEFTKKFIFTLTKESSDLIFKGVILRREFI